jgi:hypothetical protein
MEPAARVAWVIETAKGVMDGRIDPAEGAVAIRAQQAQLIGLLRHDRDGVTRRESDAVATRLRLLAEQVSDKASDQPDHEAHTEIARVLGELATALR